MRFRALSSSSEFRYNIAGSLADIDMREVGMTSRHVLILLMAVFHIASTMPYYPRLCADGVAQMQKAACQSCGLWDIVTTTVA